LRMGRNINKALRNKAGHLHRDAVAMQVPLGISGIGYFFLCKAYTKRLPPSCRVFSHSP
jgi:hypothetical protein